MGRRHCEPFPMYPMAFPPQEEVTYPMRCSRRARHKGRPRRDGHFLVPAYHCGDREFKNSRNMRGVMRHYYGRGVGRGEIKTSLIDVPVRWSYLNRPGHHPYIPKVTQDHLTFSQGDEEPCLDGQVHIRDQDSRAFFQRVRKNGVERPINRVRPRIRVPDPTTPANPREELAALMVSEASLAWYSRVCGWGSGP